MKCGCFEIALRNNRAAAHAFYGFAARESSSAFQTSERSALAKNIREVKWAAAAKK